jgi:hypothetical protein
MAARSMAATWPRQGGRWAGVGFTGVLRSGTAPVVGIGMALAVQDTACPAANRSRARPGGGCGPAVAGSLAIEILCRGQVTAAARVG